MTAPRKRSIPRREPPALPPLFADLGGLLTVAQAAERIGRQPGLIRRWILAGELPAVQSPIPPGHGPWLVRPDDIDAMADRPRRAGWTDENRERRAAHRAEGRQVAGQLTMAEVMAAEAATEPTAKRPPKGRVRRRRIPRRQTACSHPKPTCWYWLGDDGTPHVVCEMCRTEVDGLPTDGLPRKAAPRAGT